MLLEKEQFEETNYEKETQLVEEYFKVHYFLVVVDITIVSLETRFEQLKKFQSILGFFIWFKEIKALNENELKEGCIKFATAFSNDKVCDVDSNHKSITQFTKKDVCILICLS